MVDSKQLISWLTSKDARRRKRSAFILGSLKTSDRISISPFIEALTSKNDDVVFWCVCALAGMRSRSRRSVPKLIELLSHKRVGIRQGVLIALARIAPTDECVKQAVFNALNDKSAFVRRQALQEIIEIKNLSKADLAKIKILRNDADEDVARWAETTIRNIRLRSKHDKKKNAFDVSR